MLEILPKKIEVVVTGTLDVPIGKKLSEFQGDLLWEISELEPDSIDLGKSSLAQEKTLTWFAVRMSELYRNVTVTLITNI
ncbi:unnamed protein product [Heterobilharzia americana]|nr:unnamed protein product [Heterobilharzia americana]